MIEIPTYEQLLNRVLDRIPAELDRRQGSIIYNAVAPCCVEIEQLYIALKNMYDQVYIETATSSNLDALVALFGITRKEAIYAVRIGSFNVLPPLKSLFTDGTNTYEVINTDEGVDKVLLKCTSSGIVGNSYVGKLTALTYVEGLEKANLTGTYIPGKDTESDDELRVRYKEVISAPIFAGNVAAYKKLLKAQDEIGQCKITPAQGNNAGKVIATVLSKTNDTVSNVQAIQQRLDPSNSKDGTGEVPIGHTLIIQSANILPITITMGITVGSSYTKEGLKPIINKVLEEYMQVLCSRWENENQLTVRKSQIEARIVNIVGVEDVTKCLINGSTNNKVIPESSFPKLSTVTVE